MNFIKSSKSLSARSSTKVFKRLLGNDAFCKQPPPSPPFMDEVCPRIRKCAKGKYQQHWIECPRPIVIRPPMTTGHVPFVKRKAKPKTASNCLKLRDCDFSRTANKFCRYTHRPECERIPPPCPAFSELLFFKPVPELTECVCLSSDLPPLRFDFQPPCYDPRERASSR